MKSINFKKFVWVLGIVFILVGVFFITPTTTFGQAEDGGGEGIGDYQPISPSPLTKDGVTTLEEYLNRIFVFTLGIAALLAVIQITLGGISYMIGSGSGSVGAAKEKIWAAVQGILIILATYIVLSQINPEIVKFKFGVDLETGAAEAQN